MQKYQNIIIDTSVWIYFLEGNLENTATEFMVKAVEEEAAVITDIILNELLVGAINEANFKKICELFVPIKILRIFDENLEDFNLFCFSLRKAGLLGKYTDMSIAYLSKISGYPVWSLDRYFTKLAAKQIINTLPTLGTSSRR